MKWDKLKYWQKGFVIAATIHMLYFLIFIPWLLKGGGETAIGWLFAFTELLPVVSILPFLEFFLGDSILGILATGFIVTMIFGSIGALIGFFIDKYKQHK